MSLRQIKNRIPLDLARLQATNEPCHVGSEHGRVLQCGAAVLTIPAARMKAKRDHRVPLSGRALEILHDARRRSDGTGLLFRSPRGKPLSDMTLSNLIKGLGIVAVLHGFRSSLRDWAAERTNTPREVVEAALAHTVQNPTEAAYARSDLFERRRHLMDEWASALAPRQPV